MLVNGTVITNGAPASRGAIDAARTWLRRPERNPGGAIVPIDRASPRWGHQVGSRRLDPPVEAAQIFRASSRKDSMGCHAASLGAPR